LSDNPSDARKTPDAWLEFPTKEKVMLEAICTIGRTPGNRVVVASEKVSRRHAVIRKTDAGQFELTDLGSSNGTYVNGHRVGATTLLADGCIIEIGMLKMVFRFPPAVAPPLCPEDISEGQCWLLIADASERGCRTPAEGADDKTRESWNERLQRIIRKYRGTAQRALNEGLLAYWLETEGGASAGAAVITSVLESFRRIQIQTAEFRFVVHHGPVTIRLNLANVRVPTGPEVMLAMQLQRLARSADLALIITENARASLGEHFPTRAYSRAELRGYGGKHQFYTAADTKERI